MVFANMIWIFANSIGNIFCLDKHISRRTVITAILTILIAATFKLILQNEALSENISFDDLIYGILTGTVVLILYNSKLIFLFFKKYFKLNLALLFVLVFEILMSYSILRIGNYSLYSWFLAIFWLFSGIFRGLIQFSKALFEEEISNYLKIIQIFAYLRASYFSIVIISIFNEFEIVFNMFTLIVLVFLILIDFWFIANLYPYMTKHEHVNNVVELMRVVKDNPDIKMNHLKEGSGFSDAYFSKIIDRLVKSRYLLLRGNKVMLGYLYLYMNA